MISAHEVRIGNYVKCTRGNDAGIYQIFALDGKGLRIMLNGVRGGEWLRDSSHEKPEVKEIKLTEDWLLQLGFKKYDDFDYRIGSFIINGESKQLHFKGISDNIRIKSVHQLQNLYYSITLNELTII